MKNNEDETLKFNHRDPTNALKAAVEVLEKFSNNKTQNGIFSTYHLEQVSTKSTRLERMIDLIWTTFSDKGHKEQQKRDQDSNIELAEAISILKSHYPLIEKLKQGNPSQQKLAYATLEAVKRYNEIISNNQSNPHSWTSRIAKLMYEQNNAPAPIILPKIAMMETHSSKKVSDWLSHNAITCQPTRQELDAFRMKAIKMIENHALSTTIQEALSSVREFPIQVSSENQSSIISFRQVLHPFPGETIELEGAFQRNIHFPSISIPIPDSFHWSSKSIQTGFPYPSQYCGWSLSDSLIPAFPLHPQELPNLMQLIKIKEQIAIDLLPKGLLIARAKQLLAIKRQVFQSKIKTFIPLYKRLFNVILKSGNEKDYNSDLFFEFIEYHPNAYDYLSQTFTRLIDGSINPLCDALEETWLAFNEDGFMDQDLEIRLNTTRSLLKNTLDKRELPNHPIQAAFIKKFGWVLGEASIEILIQNYSEKINYKAPSLNTFQLKLQICAIQQLISFYHELTTDDLMSAEDIELSLRQQVEKDVSLFESEIGFESNNQALLISNEIKHYFSSLKF